MRPDDVRKLSGTLAAQGEIAYCVLPPSDSLPRRRGDRRADGREPMRLRSAKLLDTAFRFVSDCRICDRSHSGLRIALARHIRLPRRFAVHIDESGEIRCAKVVWRRGLVVGIRLYEHASGDQALRPVCAERTLLRHSRLSRSGVALFLHQTPSRTGC